MVQSTGDYTQQGTIYASSFVYLANIRSLTMYHLAKLGI